jgi:membrane-associated phospholipid phosphatase
LVLAAGVVLLLFAGALLACPQGRCGLLVGDSSGLAAMHAWRSPLLDGLMSLLTWAGSIVLLLPVSLLLALHLRRRDRLSLMSAAFLPLAVGSAALLAYVAKLAILRPRPELFPSVIALPPDTSFPSAHALQVAAFATAWVLADRALPRKGAWAAAAALVATVAMSRVYLQVHYPSDVILGALAGILWVLGMRTLPPWQGLSR